MTILEAQGLQKIYTTRFGGNQVQALSDVSFPWKRENMWQSWESPVLERQPS